MHFAWGPKAFPAESLDAAIKAADHCVMITSGPDPFPYRVAATVAVRDRKNALIIETLPHQKEAWQRRIEFVRGEPSCRLPIACRFRQRGPHEASETTPSLYDALNAAANGFSVVPADGRTGEPLLDVAKASTDPEVIRSWWDQYPGAVPAYIRQSRRN